MRYYLKLAMFIVVFTCASRGQQWQRPVRDLAYDARVAYCCAFGSASDYAQLIDDTQRMLARERGDLDLHLAGLRYEQLLVQRTALADRLDVAFADVGLTESRDECAIEAFEAL